MKLNLQQIKNNLHDMPPEEREATIALLSTLGINIEYKPRPIIPRILSLSSYHMRRDTQCLTCHTEEYRWYHCTNTHGVTTANFLNSLKCTPPDATSVSIVSSVTAVCRHCDEVLATWPQQKLIDLIKLRRFFSHAEDNQLRYNPRGDDPQKGAKPSTRGVDIPPSFDAS